MMAPRGERSLQWNAFVFLFSALLLAGVHSQTDFEITFSSHPMSQVVERGAEVTLSCTIQSSQSPLTFRWYHDGGEVVFVESRFAISNGVRTSTLLINTASSSDTELYWCTAEFTDLGFVRSLSAIISLAEIGPIEGATSGTMSVREFDQVVLSCPPPDSTPPAVIGWTKDSVPITPTSDGRVGITLDGTLVFSGVTVEDTGRHYLCQATNPVSMATMQSSQSVLLSYNSEQRNSFEVQQFVVQPAGTQSAVMGETAFLQCFTTAGPLSTISWYKDGSLVSPGNHITLEQASRVLVISNVSVEDSGLYWCQAEQLGFDTAMNSTAEELRVLVPPSITVGPGNQTALAEMSKTLSCEASGSTPLQWTWLHDGEPVLNDGHFVATGNQLQINNVNQSSDSGVYQCVAQHNLAGGAMSAGVLNVQVSGPLITNVTDTDVVVFVGGTVQLSCLAAGSPVPSYRWLKNDAAITADVRFSLNGGDLTLTSSVTSDTGQYVCEAYSSAGTAQSRAVLVEVIEPLAVERAPQMSKQVELGSTSTLSCELRAENTQSVNYEWTINGAVVDTSSPGSRFVLASGSGDLTISSAETSDSGLYICYGLITLVGKMADSIRQEVGESTVVVATTPRQPSNISVDNIDKRSIRLTWTPPSEDGGRDITGYFIEVRVISPFGNMDVAGFNSTWQRWNQSGLPTPMTSFDVTGLYPYTSYQFRVLAENSVGPGQASEPSDTQTTTQDVPDAPPQSVDARKSGEIASVNITWEPPAIRLQDGRGRNGLITGYTVSYGRSGEGSTTEQEVESSTRSLLVEQLLLSSFYIFQVRARTTAGAGVYSDGVTVSTEMFNPEELQNVSAELISNVSSSRGGVVNVTWDPPSIPEEFSSVVRVLSYVVSVLFSNSQEDALQEVTVSGSVTWVEISQLDWGRGYSFVVRVNYSSFSTLGPPAVGRVDPLPQGPPSPILAINPTVGVDSTLVLVWELPNDGGSPILKLTVQAFAQDVGWSVIANLSSSATTHSISDVYSTGFSRFRVVACNSVGCSWGTDLSAVVLPDRTTFLPFYLTVWFIAVVATVGLVLLTCVFVTLIAVCGKCCMHFKKGSYTMSERASSLGSVFSVRNRPPLFTLSYEQNQSLVGSDSPFVNGLPRTGHVLSDSIPRLDAHLEFGPPGEPTYGGSIISQSTVQSASTLQTQSTRSLLQAKYSGVEHHWLNQGFSQDTPEHQRRREFIRGLSDIGDSDSLVADSVASTYV